MEERKKERGKNERRTGFTCDRFWMSNEFSEERGDTHAHMDVTSIDVSRLSHHHKQTHAYTQ